MHRSASHDCMMPGPATGTGMGGVDAALSSFGAGGVGLSPQQPSSPAVGFSDWAQFDIPLTAPQPGGPPAGLKPALKKSASPPQPTPQRVVIDPLAALVSTDLI
jgi:hypothetical protein